MKKQFIKFEEWNQESLDKACKLAEANGYEKWKYKHALALQWNGLLKCTTDWDYMTGFIYEDLEEKWYTELKQEEFTRGERVLVRDYDNEKWIEKIYLTTIEWANYPFITVVWIYEKNFEDWKTFPIGSTKQIKKLPKKETPEYTMKELQEKLWEFKLIK